MRVGVDASFLDDTYKGGKEQVLLNLVRGFVHHGYASHLVVFGSQKSKHKFEAISNEILFISYPVLDNPNFRLLFKVIYFRTFILPREVDKNAVDILLMNISYTGFTRFSIPTIVMPHDIQFKYNPSQYTKIQLLRDTFCYYWDFRLRDHILAVSNFDKEQITMHYPQFSEKVKKIYNPVIAGKNSSCNHGLSYDFPYIFANNLAYPHKNADTLIEAFNKILDQTNCHLVISGHFHVENQNTKNLIIKLQTNHRLHLLGHLSDKDFQSILIGSMLYVNPSSFEGFGMSAVEAMLSSVPCLLANNSAVFEVTLGRAAYYKPSNNPCVLADSLIDCLKNAPTDAYLELTRQLMFSHYDYRVIANQYLDFFRRIL